jgi:hypothetical protein
MQKRELSARRPPSRLILATCDVPEQVKASTVIEIHDVRAAWTAKLPGLAAKFHACLCMAVLLLAVSWKPACAADVTFNIEYITESNPIPPAAGSNFSYADVWTEGGYVYVGSDRAGQGMAIFSISNSGTPVFLTEYAGSEMEDVEVWDGIGYFGSDVSVNSGTGVDIVDLSIPFEPVMLSRVNGAIGGHNKVHTLSVNAGHLYTADNATDVVKIFDVTDPENPRLAESLHIDTRDGAASHEVYARDGRLYVASKNNSITCCGWTHIYDVSTPANPVLLKAFESGPRSHTSLPTADHNTLIVAEERGDGDVHLYDVSMIDSPNDPDTPVLLSTLNRGNVGIDAHSPHHPHVHGNLLFLTWYEAGLQVFNIADPANPVHVGAFDTYPGTQLNFNGNWGVDLSLGLNKVLISDRSRGLIVVDASGVLAPGDYDQDMLVDAEDYAAWHGAFGSRDSGLHIGPIADGNGNGVVDAADYVLWRKHLGETGPSGSEGTRQATVPEPASLFLLAVGVCLVTTHRRAGRAPLGGYCSKHLAPRGRAAPNRYRNRAHSAA